MDTKKIVEEIIENKAEDGGIQQVYFVACGGSLGAFFSANHFMQSEAKKLKSAAINSNEFVHDTPAAVGVNSVVILCSHAGNTPETVKAAELAHNKGATVIGMTYTPGSPLTEFCDYVVGYKFRTDLEMNFSEDKALVPLTIVVEILNQVEGFEAYDKYQDGLNKIDGIIRNAQKQVEQRALDFAQTYKDDKIIYTMGSGAGYGAAYIQSICIFMEMQWINSSSIHTGEYFHGPFEITDLNTPFLIQMNEGRTRALDERALDFLKKYAKRYEVVDAKELGLSTIEAPVVDYFNQTLFTCVYDIYNFALADARKHPLSMRRYMWKVEY